MRCPLFRNLLHGKKNTKPATAKNTNPRATKTNNAKEILQPGGPDPVAGGTGNVIHNSSIRSDDPDCTLVGSPKVGKSLTAARVDSLYRKAARKMFHNNLLSTIQDGIAKDESLEQMRVRIATVYITSYEPANDIYQSVEDHDKDQMGVVRPERREEFNRLYNYISAPLEDPECLLGLMKKQGFDINVLIKRLQPAIAFLNENPNTSAADPEKFLKKFGLSGRS